MPCLAVRAGSGILERLVLQASFGQADAASVCEESLAIGGDEMRHRTPFPDVAVQPQAAIHRMQHPVSSLLELPIQDRGWRGVM